MASIALTPDHTAGRTLLFRVGSTVYGCDLEAVREIVPQRRATRLPGAPAYVLGLVNLRGTIITVLDVGRRLDAARPAAQDGSIILVEYGNKTVGLAVEQVMDVRVVTLDGRDERPGVGGGDEGAGPREHAGESDAIVREVGRVDDGVVVILDVQAIIRQVLLT